MEQSQRTVVTIDGPSACGKSSLAKELAKKLQFKFLNSGLLYRAIGVFLRAARIEDEESVREVLKGRVFSLIEKEGEVAVLCDGSDYRGDFFSSQATEDASLYARLKPVRESLLYSQQNAFDGEPLVAEGRDMGSVVFPKATVKIFIEVPAEERARRRIAQIGTPQDYEKVLHEILERDLRDSKRENSPTTIPSDAIIFKNYEISFDEAVKKLFQIVSSRLK